MTVLVIGGAGYIGSPRSSSSAGGWEIPHGLSRLPTAPALCSNGQPHFDDLESIVCHALAWERKLLTNAS
jgi:hypothetical protein